MVKHTTMSALGAALIGLLEGQNSGKMLVRLAS